MFGAIGRGEQIYYTLTEEMNKVTIQRIEYNQVGQQQF